MWLRLNRPGRAISSVVGYDPGMTERESPYRAPGEVQASGAPLYTFDQDQFLIDTEKKIPLVCLKCAERAGVERRETRLGVGQGGSAVGAAGGVFGAMIANVARHDPSLFLPLVLGVIAVVAVIAFVMHKNAKRVELSLPLCEHCRRAWDDGETFRGWLLAAITAAGAAVLVGKWAESTDVMIAGGVLFALALAVAIPLRLPKRFITVARLDGSRAYLMRVDAGVPAAIAARRAQRAARRAEHADEAQLAQQAE